MLHGLLPLAAGLGAALLFDTTGGRLMGFAGGVLAGAALALVLRWRAQRAGRVR